MSIKRMSGTALIRCSDKETIKQLEKLGYQKVQEHNGVVIFINDPSKPQTFSKSKVSYSGIMTMT